MEVHFNQRWLHMWETAQKLEPARFTSTERIAPAGQPANAKCRIEPRGL